MEQNTMMAPVGGALDSTAGNAAVISRAAAEVQAAVIMAKAHPRDLDDVMQEIGVMCSYRELAEVADYAFSRGGSVIAGPSIRLVESVAQAWGNVQFGWRVVEVRPAKKAKPSKPDDAAVSVVEAYAWDMQKNTRMPMQFEVPHWRSTRSGGYSLDDPRDVYELCSNMASRRVRACIERVIPKWVVDRAQRLCAETLQNKDAENIAAARAKLLRAFGPFGVEEPDILTFCKVKALDDVDNEHMAQLRGVYNSIKAGGQKAGDFFPRLAVPERDEGPTPTNPYDDEAPVVDKDASFDDDIAQLGGGK